MRPGPLDESLPITPERIVILRRLRRRLRKIIRDSRQLIIDYEYWQSLPHNVQHAGKFDIEGLRVQLAEDVAAMEQVDRLLQRIGQ